MYKISDVKDEEDILRHIGANKGFAVSKKDALKDYSFIEFTLEELGLPPADQILKSIKAIESEVGLQGWRSNNIENKYYRGFSLVYNPDYIYKDQSIYHQTFGSFKVPQIFGRSKGTGEYKQLKHTYYDSYGFRKVPPIVKKHLGYFLDKFSCSLIRSRVAYLNTFGEVKPDQGWHVDEPPYTLFRINIPLQTSPEHFIEIKGEDEYGNKLEIKKHLEVGKAYMWNTRIPHNIGVEKETYGDRIHIVLGFSPWYDYDEENDAYVKSKLFGMPINKIVKEKLFLI